MDRGSSPPDRVAESSNAVAIRPMVATDLPSLVSSAQTAIADMCRRVGRPEPPDRPVEGHRAGSPVLRQLLDLDAAGAWIAVAGAEVVGGAVAAVRERLWYLAHFHVRPGYQRLGVGRRLLAASLRYGTAAVGKLLHSSLDPQALRCYQRAGFTLEPAFQATGRLRRMAIPAVPEVRPGDRTDLDLAVEIDQLQRGAAHGPDLELLLDLGGRLLVVDRPPSRGYALIDGGPQIVSATDERTARALLWASLAESGDEGAVQVLRADQQWAIDVAVTAGLDLMPMGPLCRMGDTGPMAPYVPHTGVL